MAKQLCVYCDARPGTTSDHVVPRCLFDGNLPLDMVTVPACGSCNAAKKADDEYLRDYLVIHEGNFDHPVARSLFDRTRRATRRNQSEIARQVVANAEYRPAYTADGVPAGTMPFVPLDPGRFSNLFGRITRGLYFKLRQRRLPQDCAFKANWIDERDAENIRLGLTSVGTRYYRLGDVFGCLHAFDPAEPANTIWLQRYFSTSFLVTTGRA
jgi:hypothetical protein